MPKSSDSARRSKKPSPAERAKVLRKAASVDFTSRRNLIASVKAWVREFRSPRRSVETDDAGIASIRTNLSRSILSGDWNAARALSLELARTGAESDDLTAVREAGHYLRRLGCYAEAWQFLSLGKNSHDHEWDGSDLTGKTILIDPRGSGLGLFMQFAPLLHRASEAARHCIIPVEPRLVPLFQRSFPALDVRAENDQPIAQGEADTVATFETLARHFWDSEDAIRAMFRPLVADLGKASEFRETYERKAKAPLIGFSWGSLNKKKNSPSLSHWSELISATEGTYVSLQYGDVAPAIALMRGATSENRILVDPSVDQIVDMDRFASQLRSLDAIVTISNTCAHLAGALGIPTVVVLDDDFRLSHGSWPMIASTPPWYPHVVLVQQNGRDWGLVMAEVAEQLGAMVASRGDWAAR